MSKTQKSDNDNTYTPRIKVTPATSLGQDLKVKLVDHKIDYVVLWIGNAKGEFSQRVYHRPIGKTDLGDDVWVASSTDNVAHLLTRVESPYARQIRENRSKFLRDAAVDEKLIRITDDVTYLPGGKVRNVFLKGPRGDAKKLVKAANQALVDWNAQDKKTRSTHPPKKLIENDELHRILTETDSSDSREELAYSEFISNKASIKIAEGAVPDGYITKGGAYGDIPQVSVAWAKGLAPSDVLKYTSTWMAVLEGRNPGKNLFEGVLGLNFDNLKVAASIRSAKGKKKGCFESA